MSASEDATEVGRALIRCITAVAKQRQRDVEAMEAAQRRIRIADDQLEWLSRQGARDE